MKTIERKILRANAAFLMAACIAALLVLAVPGKVNAQAAPQTSGLLEGSIVIYVWEQATPAPANDPIEELDRKLSRELASSGLEAMSVLRQWQGHLAYSIRNGYPISEAWVAMDRERADMALQQAALRVSTDADRYALSLLVNQFESLRQWSDELLEANRNMRLANYYMSPAGLDNDALFQKTAACGNFLGPMLASGLVADHPACR